MGLSFAKKNQLLKEKIVDTSIGGQREPTYAQPNHLAVDVHFIISGVCCTAMFEDE